ncbi:type VI secretion system protein VasD [Constrictibacter sp. MBR-5]|uniref:type VI secretion system lipoprotein TssJ n=1 Tax=Constrictibacter sp. MBR-5 TaxID=3156467 RepID=UPI003395437F
MRAIQSAAVAVLLLAGACAGRSPEPNVPPPTTARFVITSAPVLNPDREGKSEPVVVRLFRLRKAEGFQQAQFDDLVEGADEKTLGPDLVGTVEFTIYPGQTETLTRTLDPSDRWLGIVAAYRDPATAKWRDLVQMPPSRTTEIDLKVGPRAILARSRDG